MLLRTAWCSLILLLLLHVRASFGLPKDSGLIQLIPPQSSLIAGMTSSAAQGTTKSFLLVTHENTMDLKDFYALTGGDATRQLKALVFVTDARREAALKRMLATPHKPHAPIGQSARPARARKDRAPRS